MKKKILNKYHLCACAVFLIAVSCAAPRSIVAPVESAPAPAARPQEPSRAKTPVNRGLSAALHKFPGQLMGIV